MLQASANPDTPPGQEAPVPSSARKRDRLEQLPGGRLQRKARGWPPTAAAGSPPPPGQQAGAFANPLDSPPSPGSPRLTISAALKAPLPVRRHRQLPPPPELPAEVLAALDLGRQPLPEEMSTAESAPRGPHPALQQAHAWLERIAAAQRATRGT